LTTLFCSFNIIRLHIILFGEVWVMFQLFNLFFKAILFGLTLILNFELLIKLFESNPLTLGTLMWLLFSVIVLFFSCELTLRCLSNTTFLISWLMDIRFELKLSLVECMDCRWFLHLNQWLLLYPFRHYAFVKSVELCRTWNRIHQWVLQMLLK